jgi:aspartate--ammonia ligase
MGDAIFPTDYKPALDFFETEQAIKLVKDTFERKLAEALNLLRVSAPRFLKTGNGLQDDLAGTQVPVRFRTTFLEEPLEMVHSLAKWKRYALGKYGFPPGRGLYTDMDAVRKGEVVDATHSVYVDQWDWEKIITAGDRTPEYLKESVRRIYSALLETRTAVEAEFPQLSAPLPDEIAFISTLEMEKEFPDLSPPDRECEVVRRHGAAFIMGIGGPLRSGEPHDPRAADYDDWDLNGDIIVFDHVRGRELEISSMGIRVDAESMRRQLAATGRQDWAELPFHRGVLDGSIPLSVGGGIGQSRLCQLLLRKAHIGEVQSSVWPTEVERAFREKKIILL